MDDGGLFQYIAWCADCQSAFDAKSVGDRIEHNGDGSHTLIPDPVRVAANSGMEGDHG